MVGRASEKRRVSVDAIAHLEAQAVDEQAVAELGVGTPDDDVSELPRAHRAGSVQRPRPSVLPIPSTRRVGSRDALGINRGDALGHLHHDRDSCPRVRDADGFSVVFGEETKGAHVAYDALEVVGIVDAEPESEGPALIRRYEPELVASVPARQDPG